MKRTPLRRYTPLRSKPRPQISRNDPARLEWKTSRGGFCTCGCARWSWHIENHHVVGLDRIKREGRLDLAYDPRNAMALHPHCHEQHTGAARRVALSAVPAAAVEFARELLGDDAGDDYMARSYRA